MTPVASQPDPYARAARRFALASKLSAAGGMLNWDTQTQMPRGGAWARGEQMAALAEVEAELLAAPAAAEDLDEAEAMSAALDPGQQANLAEMRRLWRHTTCVPTGLLTAKARMTANLHMVWVEAKARNDFGLFAAHFAELLPVIRDIAAAKAEALGLSAYGALIDEYDPGVSETMIDPLFADLAGFLPGFLQEVRERQSMWPATTPLPPVSVERQTALSQRLAILVGHDPEHFRIDESGHPFSVGQSPGDVRFTTRYDVRNPRYAIEATLHEAGHAMYEFNLPKVFAYDPVGRARGMTVHESQSLSVEMLAGRSREFLWFLAPLMAEVLGGEPEPWAESNVLRAWRRLDEDFIRVEADEASYPLHVILRYRLEKALLSGDLPIGDVPGAWNDLFRRLLGRTPPDDTRGCLQDVHWAEGLFGYFPNYAMGSMLAAQLFERANADDANILPALGRGDFGPYFDWFRPRIHQRASLTDFATLVMEATGAPLGVEAFRRHVRRRYLEEDQP